MARNFFHLTAIAVIALLILAGCVSAPVAKQAYPSGTEMYPAVYGTFSELFPNAKYANIDFYNNTYTLTGMTGFSLTTPVSYDITVKLSQAGEIDISYANLHMRDGVNGPWKKSQAFGFYNYNQVVTDILQKMTAIAGDPSEFARMEKAAMADIKFVYAIMKNFTGLAFEDFTKNYAKGSVFSVSGPVSDVKESGKKIDGTEYKYVVTLREKLGNEDNAFYSSIFDDYVSCRFYTNQDDVIRLGKTATLAVKGALIGASQNMIGTGIFMELVDVQ